MIKPKVGQVWENKRSNAQEVGFKLGIGDHMTVLIMEKLAFECYRHFANRYIESSAS